MAETLATAIPGRRDAYARLKAGDIANAAADTALVPGGVPNAVETNVEPLKDDLIDVADLVRMFEESESSTYTARQESQRDRDYYDNKQLTDEQISVLNKRGQPPVIINRIKRKIDYLVGLEKQQRIDPKALPRTPVHEQDADGATQGLRYVSEAEDYDNKRSAIWRNMLVEGVGGIAVAVEESDYGVEIKLRRFAWDRLFWDPHSSESDFTDASYLGGVIWMDIEDATAMYGGYEGAEEALENTLSTAPSDTYDDKPKHTLWADRKRKRVRICQIWLKRDRDWHFAEYTKGGILIAGPSPYQTDRGESDCELILQSSYVDRDNNRYGVVREMISPQDEINKRRSKALHLINTNQVLIEEQNTPKIGIEGLRKEMARPDGTVEFPPGALSGNGVRIETRTDLATAQFQLLQESKNEIDNMGPNATQMGDKAGGSSAASGKAIIASQQGGMIEMGDLLDNLRHLDKRVFRAIWNRIRQFWTEEKWIRITDDDRNIKWVGINVDPMQMQMRMQQDPQMQEKIAGMVANVAELDCDIIIDEAPDSVTPALEQWQALTELAKGGVPIPPDVLIEAAPNLKNKEKLLERMKGGDDPEAKAKQAQEQAQQQELQIRGIVAKILETENNAKLKEAQTFKTMVEAQLEPERAMDESQRAWQGQAQKAQSDQMRQQRPANQGY